MLASWPTNQRTGLVSEMYMRSSQIGHFFHLARFSVATSDSSVECMYRIRQGRQKMCPHLAMRGATGVERQMGQLVDCVSAEAKICKIESHSRYTSASTAWAW